MRVMLSSGRVLLLALITLAVSVAVSVAAPQPDGRGIYNFRCYFCHGYSGNSKTLASEMLSPKPRDFTAAAPDTLSRERMVAAVRDGVAGTAMKPFSEVLSDDEIAAVVDFVRDEFMRRGATNTRYHTQANGWADHDRLAAAFPFVTGEISLTADDSQLTAPQRAGRRLYFASCISCHDIARRSTDRIDWEAEAVSYPRTGFSTGDFLEPADAVSGATSFSRHDTPPPLVDATGEERRGETLFQENCAFCHAADGTGKNWIGTFMIPHPRDLTDPSNMTDMTRERLYRAIRDGLPGTSMPAWGGVLNDNEIHSVVAYIARVFHPLPAKR